MTLREKAQEFIINYPTVKHVVIDLKAQNKLIDLYFQMTGEKLTCGGCYNNTERAYLSVINYINRDSNPDHPLNRKRIMSQFTLNKDAQVYCHTSGIFVMTHNITDQLAIELLRENPKNIDYFTGYPDNYKEMIAGKSSEEQTKQEDKEGSQEEKSKEQAEEPQGEKQNTQTSNRQPRKRR